MPTTPVHPTRETLAEAGAMLGEMATLATRASSLLERYESADVDETVKLASHADRLLSLATLAIRRAALVCAPDPEGERWTLSDDEWDLVFCAMAVLDAMASTTYLDVETMIAGAVRAIADEANPQQ